MGSFADHSAEKVVVLGEPLSTLINDGSQNMLFMGVAEIDKNLLQFKKLVLEDKISDAVSFAKSSFVGNKASLEYVAEYLIKHGCTSD